MGFSSWFAVASEVTETFMKSNVAVLLSSGLAAKGYRHVNVDEGWMKGRNVTTGMFYEDLDMFPSGMKGFGDWVHRQGLLYGLYTSRGTCQCTTPEYNKRAVPSKRSGQQPEGSQGFEEQDAHFFAEAGADFIKEDSCCGSQNHAVAYGDYARMRDALNRTGRPMVFSLCGWNPWYAPVGISLANSWRISLDGNDWPAHIDAINKMAAITHWTGPGGWNDPDFLIGPPGYPAVGGQSELQSRAQMSLWCIFPAPLFISMDLTRASPSLIAILGNEEAIAVNQDRAARAGARLVGGDLSPPFGNGLPAALAPCDASEALQRWDFAEASGGTPVGRLVRSAAGSAGRRCLNVLECGSQVVYWDCATERPGMCAGGSNEEWTLADGQLRSDMRAASGPRGEAMCLGGSATRLTLVPCSGSSALPFVYDRETLQLRSGSGACLSAEGSGSTNIWAKQLADGAWAMVFLNTGAAAADITCDVPNCIARMGLAGVGATLHLRDIWAHTDNGTISADSGITMRAVGAEAGVVFLRVTPAFKQHEQQLQLV